MYLFWIVYSHLNNNNIRKIDAYKILDKRDFLAIHKKERLLYKEIRGKSQGTMWQQSRTSTEARQAVASLIKNTTTPSPQSVIPSDNGSVLLTTIFYWLRKTHNPLNPHATWNFPVYVLWLGVLGIRVCLIHIKVKNNLNRVVIATSMNQNCNE